MHSNRILKVAFFNKELPSDKPNGVSCQVDRLANALSERGHQVTVFSFSQKPADSRYAHIQLMYPSTIKLFRKFIPAVVYRRIDTQGFDIIHYHGDDYLCKQSLRRVRTFYGSALQEAIHAVTMKRFLYQALFYLFELCSAYKNGASICISRSTKKSIPNIQHIIPCGVPTRKFLPGREKTNHPSIFFLGDLDSRKRGRLLVETFNNHILKSIPDCELRIAGPQHVDGSQISYLGTIDEQQLIQEFQRSWVYCFPSSYEGFGVPAIEAMACGTPVVSAAHAGIADIITDNVDGIITDPDNLGNKLIDVLTNDMLRARLTIEGRKTSVTRFDTHKLAKFYESVYLNLLKGS